MPFTEISSLHDKIVFPVTAYLKENGFLSILSYLKDKDKLFIEHLNLQILDLLLIILKNY